MPRDKIRVEGALFYGYHGSNPAERETGQRFSVDLEVELDLGAAAASDDLSETVNYTQLYRVAKEVVEGPPHNLIESVAHTIAVRVLESFPVEAVRVKVKKLEVRIKGSILSGTSVELYRERTDKA